MSSTIFREYTDVAIERGSIFKVITQEKLEDIANETIKSKFEYRDSLRKDIILFSSFVCFISKGAKDFASEALKVSSEYASRTGEILQERVPVIMESM